MKGLKTTCIVSLIALSVVFVSAQYATVEAFPFIEVEGFVSPDFSTLSENGDGTSILGRIDYWFDVVTADCCAGMDRLSIEFEDEVFSSPGSLSSATPTGWDGGFLPSSSGSLYLALNGPALPAGERLSFTMEGAIIHNEALTNAGLWQEGQIWAQSWVAGDTCGGGDGGSTASVPEPSTILLLGSGLVGLGLLTRKRSRSKS